MATCKITFNDRNIMGSRIMNTLRMSGMASGPFVLKKLFVTKTSSRISWMLECEDRKVSEEGIRGWVTCLNANHDLALSQHCKNDSAYVI